MYWTASLQIIVVNGTVKTIRRMIYAAKIEEEFISRQLFPRYV